MAPSREDDQDTDQTRGAAVPGPARAVREVDVLPDGRRVTWYASSAEGTGSA